MKLPLSLVIITLNEEENIARCIQSVPFAQEVIVLDSESQDRTCPIAEGLGAKVVRERFRGIGAQKARAVELASHNWILSLDADEALSQDAQKAILNIFTDGPPAMEAYRLARLSFHMGRWIRHGGWFPDWQIRLFDRRQAGWDSVLLHEKVQVKGSLGTIREPILHWVFKDLTDQVQTNNRYSSWGAQELHRHGRHFHLPMLLVKPVSKFLETYIWKLGLLDGLPGLVIAVGAAYSMFIRHAKLWELDSANQVKETRPSSEGKPSEIDLY